MVRLWIIWIGLGVGMVAKLITPLHDPGGFLVAPALGIAGSIRANHLGHSFAVYPSGERAGFVGALLILAAYHAARH